MPAVVCGFPEGVPNGYVTEVSSIDKDGETTYECFEGFDLDTTNPPVCDSNGDWGGVPVCEGNTWCNPRQECAVIIEFTANC